MPSPAVVQILRQPPTGLRVLTLNAGVGKDDERLAALQGDGMALGSGFSVYPAATNLEVRGGFETSTTGWIVSGAGATITRITTDAKFGAACMEIVTLGGAGGEGAYHDPAAKIVVTGSTAYPVSVWAKSISGSTTLMIGVDWYTALDVYVSTSSAALTMTAGWARYSLAMTSPLTGLRAVPFARISPAAAATYRIDGVQFELGSVVTPYIETDGATANRVAGRVRLPRAGLFTATQGWVATCMTMGVASAIADIRPFMWADSYAVGANNFIIPVYRTTGTWNVTRYAAGVGTEATGPADASWAVGDRRLVVARWSATALAAAVNGGAFTGAADSNIPTLVNANAEVFAAYNDATAAPVDPISSQGRWAITGKGAPTDADSALMETWRVAGAVPTLSQIAMLSYASKPTCLVPAKTQDAILLPAYFGG